MGALRKVVLPGLSPVIELVKLLVPVSSEGEEVGDDLNSFARRDNLDIVEALQIKEMPVSGNDECGAVFRGKPEEQVVKGVCLDDGRNRFRIRYENDKIEEICHDFLWGVLQNGKPA